MRKKSTYQRFVIFRIFSENQKKKAIEKNQQNNYHRKNIQEMVISNSESNSKGYAARV